MKLTKEEISEAEKVYDSLNLEIETAREIVTKMMTSLNECGYKTYQVCLAVIMTDAVNKEVYPIQHKTAEEIHELYNSLLEQMEKPNEPKQD